MRIKIILFWFFFFCVYRIYSCVFLFDNFWESKFFLLKIEAKNFKFFFGLVSKLISEFIFLDFVVESEIIV